jgi:hypothetical protein
LQHASITLPCGQYEKMDRAVFKDQATTLPSRPVAMLASDRTPSQRAGGEWLDHLAK